MLDDLNFNSVDLLPKNETIKRRNNMLGSKEFMKRVKEEVAKYANEHLDKSDGKQITTDDVFIVWYSKSLQNHKALASTTLFDGMYYELPTTATRMKSTLMLTRNGKISASS